MEERRICRKKKERDRGYGDELIERKERKRQEAKKIFRGRIETEDCGYADGITSTEEGEEKKERDN